MNSLSWMIYWAEVIVAVGSFFKLLFGACVVGIFGCIVWFGAAKMNEDIYGPSGRLAEVYAASCARAIVCGRRFAIAAISAAAISIFIPSEKTVYAVAASEVGERVVLSQPGQEIAQESLETLKVWLRKMRDDGKSEKK